MNAAYVIAAVLLITAVVCGYASALVGMSGHEDRHRRTSKHLFVAALCAFTASVAFAGAALGIQYT